MRSFISSAVLATAVLGQSALAATTAHRHGHAHMHAERAEKAAAEKRAVAVSDVLSKAGVVAASNTGSIFSTGSAGPFVIDLINNSDKDIVAVVWSGTGEESTWTSMCVNTNAPTLTEAVPAGETVTISVNPGSVGSVSGGIAALYPYTDLSMAGSINNTWAEYTYTTSSSFSAVDVTRLVNMVGNEMSIETYPSYPSSGSAACVSDMNSCVFKCTDGTNSCAAGSLFSCEGPNTQNYGGTEGGCGGFTQQGGYTKITFGN